MDLPLDVRAAAADVAEAAVAREGEAAATGRSLAFLAAREEEEAAAAAESSEHGGNENWPNARGAANFGGGIGGLPQYMTTANPAPCQQKKPGGVERAKALVGQGFAYWCQMCVAPVFARPGLECRDDLSGGATRFSAWSRRQARLWKIGKSTTAKDSCSSRASWLPLKRSFARIDGNKDKKAEV